MIEPKGINSFQWVNRLGLYMSGNDKWIVPASHDERRYAVNRINESGTRQKLLRPALRRDQQRRCSGDALRSSSARPRWLASTRARPSTKALLDQKMLGMTGLEQWYVHLLSVGELPKPNPKNPRWVTVRDSDRKMRRTTARETSTSPRRSLLNSSKKWAAYIKAMARNGAGYSRHSPRPVKAGSPEPATPGNGSPAIEDWGDKPG